MGYVIFMMIAAGLCGMIQFDLIVCAEYEQHRLAWEKDGRPCGLFWFSPESSIFDDPLKIGPMYLTIKWLFSTPAWVIESPESAELIAALKRFRIAMFTFYGAVLVAFVVVLNHEPVIYR
ncbi:MAG: hypothetical protein EXS05_23555 [Planctomycetaceae bacterium]|nr:hypothetical protein [Planctomycetaceae bacterium]